MRLQQVDCDRTMQVLQRSETFQKRFNLPQAPTSRPPLRYGKQKGRLSLDVLCKRTHEYLSVCNTYCHQCCALACRKRKSSGWSSVLWWSSLLTVSAIPSYTVVATDLVSAWDKIDAAVKSTLDFPRTHRIRVPNAAHTDVRAMTVAWYIPTRTMHAQSDKIQLAYCRESRLQTPTQTSSLGTETCHACSCILLKTHPSAQCRYA